jgi:hypothetical protein
MKDLDEELTKRPDRRAKEATLRKERWAVLGVVVLLLGAVAAPQAFLRHAQTKSDALPNDGLPLKPSQADEFRGIALQLRSGDPEVPFEKYLQEIATTGANTVCLSPGGYQENAASSSLFIEQRKVPPPQRVEGLIRLAHKLGLRVVVMPMVLLENAGTGEWRGVIRPRQPDKWWEDYENFILYYAKIAEKAKAEVFIIGSELVSQSEEVDRWRRLIRKVRKVYSGRISYSANWDHYNKIRWWGDVDIIGMTTYYDLVGEKSPTLEVLLNAWKPIKKDILSWQRRFNRPIIFTEVGWPNQEGCAKAPWNYYGSTKPDPTAQANCFEAFFRTWQGEKAVAGVLVWEWRNYPGQTGGPTDTSYFPGGKPAMQVIRRFLSAPGASLRTTTAPAADLGAIQPARPKDAGEMTLGAGGRGYLSASAGGTASRA